MNNLTQYLQENLIKFEKISDGIVKIENETYQLIYPDSSGKLFDDVFEMTCDDTEEDNYVFNFGGKWYWTPKGSETDPKLNPLKYIGYANTEPPFIPWLGIHGKYEILNGSRDYKDWCKKAKFLNIKTLGLCELNTLAGTLQFQEECKSSDIKPLIGATYVIYNLDKDIRYRTKIYAKNEQGWQTLLRINKKVNVDNNGFCEEDYFWNNINDVVIVLDPKYIDYDYLKNINLSKDDLYYQLDTVQYENSDSDKLYLENLGKFIQSDLEPILIQDSYYLDKEDSVIKGKLNAISGSREFKSKNQYFKSFDDIFNELDEIFSKESKAFDELLDKATQNLIKVSKECNFEIETGKKHLPKYIMTEGEEKKYKTNENMFDCLIDEGLEEKNKNYSNYKERVEEEKEVIDYGKLRDYFLINWEQTKWCKEQKIYTGLSRGSAAGSLISYSMDITKIDPIKYGLLFSRFLTKERSLHSIADIDIDHCQLRRDEVKQHLIDKYGYNQCCSVGTYGTLQLKAAIKDLGKTHNIDYETLNIVTKIIPKEVSTWGDFIKCSVSYKRIKNLIHSYPNFANELQLLLNSNKSKSTHASAFIITPKDKEIYEWFPVRKEVKDGVEILVSEWGGEYLEKAGFLKQDILGLLQLTKFDYTNRSIKEQGLNEVDIYNTPLDDKETFKAISDGFTQDVFQFGSKGLAEYIKEVKPKEINDLIVAVALYRPGAMESGFHSKWIKIREGKEEPDFIKGWEDITKETQGLLVYQEQVMLICQHIAGFDLEETDKVRKALGKKKPEMLEKIKKDFVKGGLKNGFTEDELNYQWDFIEKTSGYLFNKSHAVAYGITGYISAYLKVKHALANRYSSFTLISDNKDKDLKTAAYISEINNMGDIKMLPPDINKSGDGFTPNFKNNSIYWSLNSVKQCGDKAVEQLVKDKEESGEYFSFEEFLTRNVRKGSKVTKQVIENLIMSGAFDEMENIKYSKDRKELIYFYRNEYKIKIDKEKDIFSINSDYINYNWWWNLQQKKLCGFALFDFQTLCEEYLESKNYKNSISIQEKECVNKYISTGGYINEIIVRQSKKGEYADIIIDNNFEFTTIRFWQDSWELAKDLLDQKEKSLLLITGKVSYDNYKKMNVLYANEDSDVLILE